MKTTFFLLTVMILLVAFWGAMAVYRTQQIESQVQSSRTFSNTYTELINLLAITQEMRRREKDFFLRKDIIYAKQYENLAGQADQHLEVIKKQGGFADELGKLDTLLRKHRETFISAVKTQEAIGFDLDKGIQGRMRTYIHDLEDLLAYKIKNDKLTLQLFTIRRNEKNFLLKMQTSPDQPTPEVAKEFETYLKALPIKQELKTNALNALSKYIVEFKALVAKENSLQASTALLTSTFTEFERTHYKLLNQTKASAEDSHNQVIESIRMSRMFALILAVLTLLAALAAAIRLRKHASIS